MLEVEESQRWELKQVANYLCLYVEQKEKQQLGYTSSNGQMSEIEPELYEFHPNRKLI